MTNGIGMVLCWCPPGRFVMGSPEGELGRFDDEVQVTVELTRGFWIGKYPSGPVVDPTGPPSGALRVFRGGSWDFGAVHCRSACRNYFVPAFRLNYLGLRPALVPSGGPG